MQVRKLITFYDKWFRNLTDVPVPWVVTVVVALGHKFSIPIYNVSKYVVFEIIKCVKSFMYKIAPAEQLSLRQILVTLLANSTHSGSNYKHKLSCYLTCEEC